jgi:hypothetical protein
MEIAYEALLDVGIGPRDGCNSIGARVGLFVGSANHTYHLHIELVVSDSFRLLLSLVLPPIISTLVALTNKLCEQYSGSRLGLRLYLSGHMTPYIPWSHT